MKRGLIVDDAAIMRLRLRDILNTDYEIVGEAADGSEAIKMYEMLKPDFITLDISMPHLDGLQALEALMRNNPPPKVVMVSAVGQQKLVLDALKAGAGDFVIKPFEKDRVLKAVNRVLQ